MFLAALRADCHKRGRTGRDCHFLCCSYKIAGYLPLLTFLRENRKRLGTLLLVKPLGPRISSALSVFHMFRTMVFTLVSRYKSQRIRIVQYYHFTNYRAPSQKEICTCTQVLMIS